MKTEKDENKKKEFELTKEAGAEKIGQIELFEKDLKRRRQDFIKDLFS